MGRATTKPDGERSLTLWAYATDVWRRPDVEPACLELQNAYGHSPPLLLWRLWAIEQRRPLDIATIENAVAATRRWENTVTRPLRAVHQSMKSALPVVHDQARADIRGKIRAVELDAERALLDALDGLTPAPGERRDDGLSALLELAAIWGSSAPIFDLRRLLGAAG